MKQVISCRKPECWFTNGLGTYCRQEGRKCYCQQRQRGYILVGLMVLRYEEGLFRIGNPENMQSERGKMYRVMNKGSLRRVI